MPKTLEKIRRIMPINKDVKKTGKVITPVEIKTMSVTNKDKKEKTIGINIFANICFHGEIGRYLTMIKAFPSLLIEDEADALITPANRRIKARLIPDTSSGK